VITEPAASLGPASVPRPELDLRRSVAYWSPRLQRSCDHRAGVAFAAVRPIRDGIYDTVILTGRTHGCSDHCCCVKIALANPEPCTLPQPFRIRRLSGLVASIAKNGAPDPNRTAVASCPIVDAGSVSPCRSTQFGVPVTLSSRPGACQPRLARRRVMRRRRSSTSIWRRRSSTGAACWASRWTVPYSTQLPTRGQPPSLSGRNASAAGMVARSL
jgi:hypothetical protein